MFDYTATVEATEATAVDFKLFNSLKSTGKVLALDFMKRLAEDDEFRAAMVRNPVATAASFGFELDASKLPENGVQLPSKAVIARYLDIMATRFSASPEAIIVFRL
jgi:hypothetical protein